MEHDFSSGHQIGRDGFDLASLIDIHDNYGFTTGNHSTKRYWKLLEDIKSNSSARIMQGVIDLSSELSMFQENTLTQFSSDSFIKPLLNCITMDSFPDIMLHGVICLTYILDIRPNTCNKVVNEGGVKLLCEKMANFAYVDLAEAALKALQKIVIQNPRSILTNSVIPVMLNLLDFFEFNVQSCKSINNMAEMEVYFLESIPYLCNVMQAQNSSSSKQSTESTTAILLIVSRRILNFYNINNWSNYVKYQMSFERFISLELLGSIIGVLDIALGGYNRGNNLGQRADIKVTLETGSLSAKTWENCLSLLKDSLTYSPHLVQFAVSNGLFEIMIQLFGDTQNSWGETTTQTHIIDLTLLVLDATLPANHISTLNFIDEEEEREMESKRWSIEVEKEKILTNNENVSKLDLVCEFLLPAIFRIYEQRVNYTFKFSCLQAIDKLLNLCNTESISTFITPNLFTHFLSQILSSKEGLLICVGLKITETLLIKMGEIYLQPLMREGIEEQITKFQFERNLLKQRIISIEKHLFLIENPFIKYFNYYSWERFQLSPNERPQREIKQGSKYIYREENIRYESNLGGRGGFLCEWRYTKGEPFLTLLMYIFYISASILHLISPPSTAKESSKQIFASIKLLAQKLNLQAQLFDSQLSLSECKIIIEDLGKVLLRDGITNYEMKHSGLLTAIWQFLCRLPMQNRGGKQPLLEEFKEGGKDSYAVPTAYIPNTKPHILHNDPQFTPLLNRLLIFVTTLAHTTSNIHSKTGLEILMKCLHNVLYRIDLKSSKLKKEPPRKQIMQEQKCIVRVIYSPKGEKISGKEFERLWDSQALGEIIRQQELPQRTVLNLLEFLPHMQGQMLRLHKFAPILSVQQFLSSKLKKSRVREGRSYTHINTYDQFVMEAKRLLLSGIDGNMDMIKQMEKLLTCLSVQGLPNTSIIDLSSTSEDHHYYTQHHQHQYFGSSPESDDNEELVSADDVDLDVNVDEELKRGMNMERPEVPGRIMGPRLGSNNKGPSHLATISSTSKKHLSSQVHFNFFYNGHKISPNMNIFQILHKFAARKECCAREAAGYIIYEIRRKVRTPQPTGDREPLNNELTPFDITSIYNKEALLRKLLATFQLGNLGLGGNSIYFEHTLSIMHLLNSYQQLKPLGIWSPTNSNHGLRELERKTDLAPSDFVNTKLDQIIMRQLQNPDILLERNISERGLLTICRRCGFLLPYSTKVATLKVRSFPPSRAANYVERDNFSEAESGMRKQKIRVHRDDILSEGMRIFKELGRGSDIGDNILEFEYIGEEGIGLGPTLEYYTLVADILKEYKDLWMESSSNSLFPRPLAIYKTIIVDLFEFMGSLIAKCIIDNRLIDLPFNPLFWELALGAQFTLWDIQRIDPLLGQFISQLQHILIQKNAIQRNTKLTDKDKHATILGLTLMETKIKDLELWFIHPGYEDINLKMDGGTKRVTIFNLGEYIHLVVRSFQRTCNIQLTAFRNGFNRIFNLESLEIFRGCEIVDLVCGGGGQWDMETLMDNLLPDHGYTLNSPQFLDCLKYMGTLNTRQQKLFLRFITGSPRLPIGGFSKLNPKLTIVKRVCPFGTYIDNTLPTVMTCVNYLKIPAYSCYEVLVKQMEYAINEGLDNFTLS